MSNSSEILSGNRFAFGANWAKFLKALNSERIALAEHSIQQMLDVEDLEGKRFLDAGSGSGLFSLAARRLGASVVSFDFDPQSVACANKLKNMYFQDDEKWSIAEGSVLDDGYISSLGSFDIVYSWGVLHHTGEMWKALENAASLVGTDGEFFIAIYNDQGRASKNWTRIKKLYNRTPWVLRWMVLLPVLMRLRAPSAIRDMLQGRPFHSWRNYYKESRGMSPWHDMIDWIGGLPFEVARPEEILDFHLARGFSLCKLKTCAGGKGCNEYVFKRTS